MTPAFASHSGATPEDDSKERVSVETICIVLQTPVVQAQMLQTLLCNSVATTELLGAVTGLDARFQRVMIHRLRSRLARRDIQIQTVRGVGYYLLPEDRSRTLAMLEAFSSSPLPLPG